MREWPLRIINYLTGFLLLSSLHCAVAAVVVDAGKSAFFFSMIYLPIVISMSAAQKKVTHFWQFAMTCGVILCIVYMLSRNAFERGLSCTLVTLAAGSFFYARAKKNSCWLETPIYAFLGLYVIMYLLEMRFKNELLRNYAVFGAGICYLLCIYKINLDEMNRVVDASSQLERFPVKRLFQSNYLMMGVQTLVVVLGMCALPLFGADGVMSRLLHTVREGIAWLLRRLEFSEDASGTVQEATNGELVLLETREPSKFMEFVLALGEVLGWIIVIALTVYVLYVLVKKLYQLYLQFDAESAENGDRIEQLYMTRSRDEKKRIKQQKQKSLRWDNSPNARIRKTYKKRVLKELKGIPNVSMTPAEIEMEISMEKEQKVHFHNYYEKARYGKEPCTKEEAQGYRF